MFNDALSYILELFKKLGTTLYDIFNDLFLFIFDSVMTAVMLLVNSLTDLLQFIDFSEYYDSLPSDFLDAAAAVGLHEVFGIFLAAHTIKLLLQLIPFVRLGSK
ncbi:TPA: VSK receptor [Vibrio campbellii]